MAYIKPGDRVRTHRGTEVLVIAVTAMQAWCQYASGDCVTWGLASLTPIAPEPEPADGLLTGAQLAQLAGIVFQSIQPVCTADEVAAARAMNTLAKALNDAAKEACNG